VDVERPGDGADGFSVADEFSGEFLLVRQHFLWPAKGHAARLGGQPAFLRAAEDAPRAVIPKAWQPLVLDADGRMADPKAYVFAVIDAWRPAVKRRCGSAASFGADQYHNALKSQSSPGSHTCAGLQCGFRIQTGRRVW
jgi:hypothetical protein